MQVDWARQIVEWAIVAIFLFTFVPASLEKIRGGLPDWFRAQFSKTILAKIPFGISGGFWTIALLESLTVVLFGIAIFQGEPWSAGAQMFWAQIGVAVGALTFACLSLGLRLAGDYQGAANTFAYFGASLVAFLLLAGRV